MPFRLYIVPVVGTGASVSNARRPKYFNARDGIISSGQSWSALDFGLEPVMVVGANLTLSDDLLIVGQPDVTAFPFDLAPTLTTGEVIAIRTKLETLNVPALWVNTSLTWLFVLRTILGMFTFLQRYAGIYAAQNGTPPPSLFGGGVTLNTTFGALPALVQAALLEAARSFLIPTTGLTATTTLRVILRNLADQFQAQQYDFNETLL